MKRSLYGSNYRRYATRSKRNIFWILHYVEKFKYLIIPFLRFAVDSQIKIRKHDTKFWFRTIKDQIHMRIEWCNYGYTYVSFEPIFTLFNSCILLRLFIKKSRVWNQKLTGNHKQISQSVTLFCSLLFDSNK